MVSETKDPVILLKLNEFVGGPTYRFSALRFYDVYPLLAPIAREFVRLEDKAESAGMGFAFSFLVQPKEPTQDEIVGWIKKRYSDAVEG